MRAVKDLRRWMEGAGLSYHSPHKFRHGHAVYALKQCSDVADLKAVSQNLMHADLRVTDGVYGILRRDDVKERIARLNGHSSGGAPDKDTLIAQIEVLLGQLKGDT